MDPNDPNAGNGDQGMPQDSDQGVPQDQPSPGVDQPQTPPAPPVSEEEPPEVPPPSPTIGEGSNTDGGGQPDSDGQPQTTS